MKKYLLVLTTLFISSSCWAQFDMEKLASKYPEYTTRINAANKFLKSIGIELDKDHMDYRINRVEGRDSYFFSYSHSENGRVAIVIEANKPGTDISFNPTGLFYNIIPYQLFEFVSKAQISGNTLTDVLNIDNVVTTNEENGKNSLIQEVIIPNNQDEKSTEKKVFKGPVLILVTLDKGEQIYLEEMMFTSIPMPEFSKRLEKDGKFSNAFDDFASRRDFRNSLLLYVKSNNLYLSDIEMTERVMNRLFTELESSNYKELSEESINLLSRGRFLNFLKNIYKIHPDIEPFYDFVEKWQGNFAEQSSNEFAPNYEKIKDPEIEKARNIFYKKMATKIRAYIEVYKDRSSFK